jgi:tetratricopeptide (TPR) repeat protein
MKYRKFVLIVFIVLVGASLIYALTDKRKVTTSSDKAYQAYLNGEDLIYRLYTREALQEFEKAVKLDPNFAMAYARLAWLYKDFDKMDEYQKARTKAISLLDRIKEKEQLVINLGFAQADGKTEDFNRYLAELLKKYPDSFEAHDYLAAKYYGERNYDKSINENLLILKKDPNHAASYNLLAYSYAFKGDYDKALEYIDKYSSLAEDQANPHDSHGEILLNIGRYDEALVQFRKADSIKAGLYFVVSHIGDTYAAKGMFRDAIGAYLKAREIGPNEKYKTNIDANIAMCYMYSEQNQKAIELLKEIIARVPDDVKSNALLGGIYAEQGDMEDALMQLGIVKGITSKLLQESPKDVMSVKSIKGADYYLSARVAQAKGDYHQAVEKLKLLYDDSMLPDRMLYSAFLGRAYLKAQLPDSAIAILTLALKDNPNNAVCLRALADAYGQIGQKDVQKVTLNQYLSVMKDADDGLPDVRRASAELEQLNRKTL